MIAIQIGHADFIIVGMLHRVPANPDIVGILTDLDVGHGSQGLRRRRCRRKIIKDLRRSFRRLQVILTGIRDDAEGYLLAILEQITV